MCCTCVGPRFNNKPHRPDQHHESQRLKKGWKKNSPKGHYARLWNHGPRVWSLPWTQCLVCEPRLTPRRPRLHVVPQRVGSYTNTMRGLGSTTARLHSMETAPKGKATEVKIRDGKQRAVVPGIALASLIEPSGHSLGELTGFYQY